jgi:putative ABC transport system permease protein
VRLSSVIHLYRVRLRSRLVQELLALAGIAVGVGLVFAALIANASLTGSVRQITDGLVGDARFQLAARGPDGFDERLLVDVRRIDGVKAAAPIVEAQANLVGPKGRRSVLLVGGDPRFARLGGRLLRRFRAPELPSLAAFNRQQALALPAPTAKALGLSLGQPIRVEVGTRVVRLSVDAELERRHVGPLAESPVAMVPLGFAQEIAGLSGRLSRIYVQPEQGRDTEVEAGLRRLAGGRLNVRAADADVAIFERAAYPANQSTALFSVFSALVGFLFAFSAMLLTVPQRRRLIADLRMAGHEPWVLVQLLLFDALVLGIAGSLLGLGLGDRLSRLLFDTTPDYLASAFAVGTQRIVTWQSVAIAGAAGVVAACVAVLAPLRDILARPALPARPATGWRERQVAVAGAGCLVVAVAIVIAAPSAAMVAVVALTLALLLLLPLLLCAATSALEALGRPLRSPVPILAILELRSGAAQLRTLAVAATGAIAVFATVAIGGAHADLERGLEASARDIDSNADVWITFEGNANALATTPFSGTGARTAAVGELAGVRAVRAYRGGFLDIGDRRAWVVAPPRAARRPIPPSQIQHGGRSLAEARMRQGGWIALSEAIADEWAVGVGDRVRLPSPSPTAFRVAAVTTNLGWPSGAIVLNADDYARAWGTPAVSALHVELAPGVAAERVRRAVERALGPKLPLRVETRRERVARHYGTASDALSRLTQISVLVLISAALAMAAAMGGMIWQRRRTLAALKVHGYPELELWRALLLESGLLLGTGCLIGAAFGLFGQVLLSRALETITGFPVFYSAAALVAVGILALVTLVAVAMLAVPGWLAVRVRPAPGAPG